MHVNVQNLRISCLKKKKRKKPLKGLLKCFNLKYNFILVYYNKIDKVKVSI